MENYNYIFSFRLKQLKLLTENIEETPKNRPFSIFFRSIAIKLKSRLFQLKNDVYDLFLNKKYKQQIDGKIWLYVETVNQYNALEPISKISNTIFITRSKVLLEQYEDIVYLPLRSKLRFRITRMLNGKRREVKRFFEKEINISLFPAFVFEGVYEATMNLFNSVEPKAIVFSNDHNVFNRNLLFVANKHNIKTIFIQHAAVSEIFPPLDFGLNLLEGEDSLQKYQSAGPIRGDVKLVGMLKFDKYFKYVRKAKESNIKVIGISLNPLDYVEKYFRIIDIIKAEFQGIEIIVRPHPRMTLNVDFSIGRKFSISNPQISESFDYLKEIDLQIAGNSSIHLEATLLNIPSVQIVDFNQIKDDYYGFKKNSLIDIIKEEEIIDKIYYYNSQLEIDYRSNAKYYNSVISTEWDGKSFELISNAIKEYIGS